MDLSKIDFEHLIRLAPLVSIDLIVKNSKGDILLGMRRNSPAQGSWFVPGGRIKKDESIATAFERKAHKELGVVVPYTDASFLGVYEHFYKDNALNFPGFGTHYVVSAYEIRLTQPPTKWPPDEHSDWKWWKVEDLVASKQVHDNTKAYFLEPNIPADSRFYGALMAHHLHFDRQMWSRTQMILAIQGATFAGAITYFGNWLGHALLFSASILTLIIWLLIQRDAQNRDTNLPVMDQLARRIMSSTSEGRVVSVRSESYWWTIRGKFLVNAVVLILIIVNLAFAYLSLSDVPIKEVVKVKTNAPTTK